MFKKLLFLLPLACLLSGCAEDVYYQDPSATVNATKSYGCVNVWDDYGEREVCNTYCYYVGADPYYWDAHFNIWVGPSGYWHGGRYFRGYYPGWHGYYHSGLYHPHGYFRAPADSNGHGGGRPPPGHLDHNYGRGGGNYHGGGHGGHR